MKKLVLIIVAVLFSGCFDVNLKSELPNIEYYSLDNVALEDSKVCEAYNLFGLNKIEIPPIYQHRNILYKDSNKVLNLQGASLSNSLESELESIIIKDFAPKCLKIITPPFSGMDIEQFMRIKLLDFIINKDSMEAKVSIFYAVYQKGVILQSGILSSSTPLKSLQNDEAIKAMQDSTLEVVNKLANKVIPK